MCLQWECCECSGCWNATAVTGVGLRLWVGGWMMVQERDDSPKWYRAECGWALCPLA